MTAATLDVMSGGRFRLGLGVSGPQVSEGWHGVPFAKPPARTREYVEVVRRALAREAPLEYEGEEFTLPVEGTGLGKPLKLLTKPVQERIPIYLGAIGPKAVEQTAEIADGWLPFFLTEDSLATVRDAPRDIDISPVVLVCLDDDPARARDLARPWLALYPAPWAPEARTSTSRRPTASATATRRGGCRSCGRPATVKAPRPRSATS